MPRRKVEDTEVDKQKFLAIYPQVGSVSKAAQELGVCRQTIHTWLKDDEFLNADYLFQKYINVTKILENINAGATGERKITMPELSAAQYLLSTFLPRVFVRYKEKHDETRKITKMVVRKDKGGGKVETEEYEIKEASQSDSG